MKILKIFFVLIVCAILFKSCNKDDDEKNVLETNQLEFIEYNENFNTEVSFIDNEFNINFKSKINKNKIISEVTILNSLSKNKIHSDSFMVDKNKKSYKLNVSSDIEIMSVNLKNKFRLSQWLNIQKKYKTFLKSLSQKVEIEQYQSDLIQSSFYHLSVYSTIIRSFENTKDCECTTLPAYLVGKSAFWCQEDYFFNVNELISYYDDNKDYLLSLKGGEKEYNYLKEIEGNKDKVSNKELFSLHHSVKKYKEAAQSEFKKAQNNNNFLNKDRDDCWWGIYGSDLGCCGNYSGCCWFASMDCLRHDIACLKCDKWHCGPACKPS